LGCFLVDVDYEDIGSAGGKSVRDRAADSAAGAGDNGRLAVEPERS
jgi:hypothetical protein